MLRSLRAASVEVHTRARHHAVRCCWSWNEMRSPLSRAPLTPHNLAVPVAQKELSLAKDPGVIIPANCARSQASKAFDKLEGAASQASPDQVNLIVKLGLLPRGSPLFTDMPKAKANLLISKKIAQLRAATNADHSD